MLTFVSLFLLAFIPLYPKIPLFDILPGYIVRVRVEDILMVLASGLWFWHALKHRAEWRNGYLGFVGIYAFAGLLTIALGIFLLQTIPLELLHVGKSALHYFRYLEYFSLFFIVFSGIRTKRQTRIALFVLAATTFLVTLYGFGQKYMHFPLYSTMNREYSKGQAFYLEAGGKVSSTFGGHYDLAAFLVIVLPMLFAFSLTRFGRTKKKLLVFGWLQLTHLAGLWLLIETGSKTALISYLLALTIVVVLNILRIQDKRLKALFSSAALAGVVVMAFLFLTLFGAKTKDRFTNLFQSVFQDQQNVDPTDLVGNGYEWKTHTQTSPDGVVTTTRELEKSTWSPNAIRYGISMGIRLDTLWPQAIRGLNNNPLFGSGYGTLSKIENSQYTEADSTDNNYLRTLGETGLIGFVLFYGFILVAMRTVKRKLPEQTGILHALSIGYLGASAGLLLNALYIDVFAASKVAFIYWGVSGLTLSMVARAEGLHALQTLFGHLNRHKSLYVAVLLSFFILHQNPLATNSRLHAFDTSSKSLENFVAARCFIKTHSFDLCRSDGSKAGSNFTVYSVLLVPFVWLSKNPAVYYHLNFSLVLLVLIVVHKKIAKKSFLSLLFIVGMAYEYGFSRGPLEDIQLLRLLILTPVSLWLLQKFLLHGKHARVTKIVIYGVLMFIPVLRTDFAHSFIESFRNVEQVVKRDSVLQANVSLKENSYLITTLSPYYTDLYSSQLYQVLPLSSAQVYTNLLEQGSKLFLTEQGISENKMFFDDFTKLRKNFDVRYLTIDCFDKCSLYTVKSLSEKISPIPSTITTRPLNPAKLPASYSFAVVANRYDENALAEKTILTKLAGLQTEPFEFLIVTGDIVNTRDKGAIPTINALLTDNSPYPILYNPGNYDLLPQKPYDIHSERFYSDRDYFITLDIGADSVATNEQRIFVFNALLELEQLPDIKNLFIISHDLNWQDQSNQKNFIHQLDAKLREFPDLDVYVLTADHGDAESETALKKGNITYRAGSLRAKVDATGIVSISSETL
ncbi:MAG: O-antigen ligase family protein [Candidatus Pacebacteria bacterium]|nr:O-antigen ligase family protein [Candidatus Paceibacterota bacterium]